MATKPKPDRFATVKAYFTDADRIRNHPVKVGGGKGGPRTVAAGPSALLALVAMWAHCDGRTGKVTMTVVRLAALIGSTRDTAHKSLTALQELGYIAPMKRKDGTVCRGRWIVAHLMPEAAEADPPPHRKAGKGGRVYDVL